jgi:hypothetical protein
MRDLSAKTPYRLQPAKEKDLFSYDYKVHDIHNSLESQWT